jgi:uncharacterized protein VirK/YbjX
MIVQYLFKYWKLKRKEYGARTWLACVLRSSRVLLYRSEHARLCRSDIYRGYVADAPATGGDVFHHLSHRYYLAKGLSLRQRVDFLLSHYGFDDRYFNAAYKAGIYRGKGLALWQRRVGEVQFDITLTMGSRTAAEGDLVLALFVDGQRLHSMNFSWMADPQGGAAAGVLPFVARNQGRWRKDTETLQKFEDSFPNNSPKFFCFAAMRGVAEAVGARQIQGVKSVLQVHYDAGDADDVKHFGNAYDAFWESVDGSAGPSIAYEIPVVAPLKPLEEVAAKHRKRTATRREHWREINASVCAALSAYRAAA